MAIISQSFTFRVVSHNAVIEFHSGVVQVDFVAYIMGHRVRGRLGLGARNPPRLVVDGEIVHSAL
jgi:hypothetical protein